ncbi:ABC transporter permease subunit [Halosegnis longus]|uniref:ABC transporter permease subunit n=1 Tax=Halosegnis longus TaxID=2216012 RepID=UPI00129E98F7|nr:ABC transporter permease subunit [Halosegnis longus]
MSVAGIARKDIADAGRSKVLWAVTILVVLSTAGVTALVTVSTDEAASQVFRLAMQLSVTTLPIVALLLAKGAITTERESGSLRVLLSLPPGRRDILLGKLAGRTALMLAATLLGGLATALVAVVTLGSGAALVAPFIGALGLMGCAFVGLGVGISAASRSDGRATALAVGAYMIFIALWNLIITGIRLGAVELGFIESGAQPGWLTFVGLLSPNRAAVSAFDALASGRLLTTDPFGSVWLPVILLIGWLIIAPALGYLRFRNSDIV